MHYRVRPQVIYHFSNPEVMYNGTYATGVSRSDGVNGSDNAYTLRWTVPYVMALAQCPKRCPTTSVCVELDQCCSNADCGVERVCDSNNTCSCLVAGMYWCATLSACIPSTHCCNTTQCPGSLVCPAANSTCSCPAPGQKVCSSGVSSDASGSLDNTGMAPYCIASSGCCNSTECGVSATCSASNSCICWDPSKRICSISNNNQSAVCIGAEECCGTADCGVGGAVCTANQCICPALGTYLCAGIGCINSGSCCNAAQCTSPLVCPFPGGVCSCPGVDQKQCPGASDCVANTACCSTVDCSNGLVCPQPGGSCTCPAKQKQCPGLAGCVADTACCSHNDCPKGWKCPQAGSSCIPPPPSPSPVPTSAVCGPGGTQPGCTVPGQCTAQQGCFCSSTPFGSVCRCNTTLGVVPNTNAQGIASCVWNVRIGGISSTAAEKFVVQLAAGAELPIEVLGGAGRKQRICPSKTARLFLKMLPPVEIRKEVKCSGSFQRLTSEGAAAVPCGLHIRVPTTGVVAGKCYQVIVRTSDRLQRTVVVKYI